MKTSIRNAGVNNSSRQRCPSVTRFRRGTVSLTGWADKSDGAGSWRHTEIRLLPENHAFAPVILRDVRDDEFHVIAEVVEVLTSS